MINHRLDYLLESSIVSPLCTYAEGNLDKFITGISYHSAHVKRGHLFAALRGYTTDGHLYISDAIRHGAVAILAEENFPSVPGVTKVMTHNSREVLSAISAQYYGNPTAQLQTIGITGTNGKSTVLYLVKDLLEAMEEKVGLLGTTGLYIGDKKVSKSPNTTPESTDIHKMAYEMLEAGCGHMVMEVTSHALDQKRVEHCVFAVAIFTNLTYEHLDWHGSMEDYFKSKAHLFELLPSRSAAVVNIDDPYGGILADSLQDKVRLYTYGLEPSADITASEVEYDSLGNAHFLLRVAGKRSSVSTRLFGSYNISNALAAIGCGMALGVPFEHMVATISVSSGAPGRFQRIEEGQNFSVIVDYAHTPDGFLKLFENVKRIRNSNARVIVVFGSAGHFRDQSKRPMMGKIASEFADIVVLTEEDSRTEDTWKIMNMISDGMNDDRCRTYMIEDRADAIKHALSLATDNDIVLILGKGDETFLDIDHASTWSGDIDTTKRILRQMGKAAKN